MKCKAKEPERDFFLQHSEKTCAKVKMVMRIGLKDKQTAMARIKKVIFNPGCVFETFILSISIMNVAPPIKIKSIKHRV